MIHPDDCSDVIIQAYQKYLKGKAWRKRAELARASGV
jgi:hypothetical protein